jgi:hypothetical protein
MELDVLAETLDRLCATDRSALADTESIKVLQAQLARLECVVTEAVAAFDAAGNWVPDEARSATSWLTGLCRISRGQAGTQLRRGRALRSLPGCAKAWAEGAITGSHVDVMSRLRTEATADAFDRDESLLVEQARSLRFNPFLRATAYWRQLADPDGTNAEAEVRRTRRDVSLVSSYDGTWLGSMTLDPVSGTIVANELEHIVEELFRHDWDQAKEELGREPLVSELSRTPSQRRADALVEMATRSRTAPRGGRRPAPLFTVLVGYETLQGAISELADGAVVPPRSLLGWLEGADIERAVFSTPRRVDISARQRFFTGATRRAVEVRDRHCMHPTCEEPVTRCEVDHIEPYACGGATTQENGRLLCGTHNRLRVTRPSEGPRAATPAVTGPQVSNDVMATGRPPPDG